MPGYIQKQTYATPETLDFDYEGIGNSVGHQIAGPAELSFIRLTVASAGSGLVKIYDGSSSTDETDDRLKLVLDAANTVPDTLQFTNPIAFGKGIWVVMETGQNLKCILSYATVMPSKTVV